MTEPRRYNMLKYRIINELRYEDNDYNKFYLLKENSNILSNLTGTFNKLEVLSQLLNNNNCDRFNQYSITPYLKRQV